MAEKHHYYFDTEQQRACPTCGSVMAPYQIMEGPFTLNEVAAWTFQPVATEEKLQEIEDAER